MIPIVIILYIYSEFCNAKGPRNKRTMSGNNSAKETETEESLPDGWSKQCAPDGRVYFVDHLKKKVGGIVPYEYLKKHLPDDMGGP